MFISWIPTESGNNSALPVQKMLLAVSPIQDQSQLPLTGMSSEQLEQLCQKDKTGTTETKNRKKLWEFWLYKAICSWADDCQVSSTTYLVIRHEWYIFILQYCL